MSEYEFAEKLSEYTQKNYGFSIKYNLYTDGRPVVYAKYDNGFEEAFYFEPNWGHLPFEEGMYQFVNDTIERMDRRGWLHDKR